MVQEVHLVHFITTAQLLLLGQISHAIYAGAFVETGIPW